MSNLTSRQIRDKYRNPNYSVNTCAAYYMELHDNGHYDKVLSFLMYGDAVIGRQGYTYDKVLVDLCDKSNCAFTDSRGEYAGTHTTYTYRGQHITTTTNWSLFA